MKVALLTALVVCLTLAGGSQAFADELQEGSEARPVPNLNLDRLLRPRSVPTVYTQYGGRGRSAWEAEFAQARSEVGELELKVAEAKVKYRAASGGEWSYSPIGGGQGTTATDPEVLKIRAEIKRDRQSLETSRKRLRELGVEASLAGVPDEWTLPR